jgi:hypothetical protein
LTHRHVAHSHNIRSTDRGQTNLQEFLRSRFGVTPEFTSPIAFAVAFSPSHGGWTTSQLQRTDVRPKSDIHKRTRGMCPTSSQALFAISRAVRQVPFFSWSLWWPRRDGPMVLQVRTRWFTLCVCKLKLKNATGPVRSMEARICWVIQSSPSSHWSLQMGLSPH